MQKLLYDAVLAPVGGQRVMDFGDVIGFGVPPRPEFWVGPLTTGDGFRESHIAFTAPFNMSEQPAASLCAGHDEDGLPIGLQIVGHRFDDLGVLRMARAYETLRPPLRLWPAP